MKASSSLILVKVVHTLAWAFFAGCILALPIAAYTGRFQLAVWLIAAVALEVVVLVFNRWACPLTGLAARYTPARHDNFDIYLPLWLARYNKHIFGALYVAGLVYTAVLWYRHLGGV